MVAVPASDDEAVVLAKALSDGRWLAMIWRLTSISRAEFDATYQPFLVQASAMMERARALDLDVASVAAEQKLMHLVATILKVRKARIIPRNAGLENASRMAETMSFALVVACVLDQVLVGWRQADLTVKKTAVCPLVDGFDGGQLMVRKTVLDGGAALLFLPSVLTPIAMRWLWKEPHCINELVQFFGGVPKGELRPLIQMAKQRAGLSDLGLVAVAKVVAVTEPPPSPAAPEGPVEPEEMPVQAGLEDESEVIELNEDPDPSDAGELFDEADISLEMDEAINDVEVESGQGELLPRTSTKKAKTVGTDFVGWLRAGLESGELTANQSDSSIHLLADGNVFLKMPYLLRRFADETGQRPKQVQNKISRKGTIRKRLNGQDFYYAKHPTDGVIGGLVFLKRRAFFGSEKIPTSEFISELMVDKSSDSGLPES